MTTQTIWKWHLSKRNNLEITYISFPFIRFTGKKKLLTISGNTFKLEAVYFTSEMYARLDDMITANYGCRFSGDYPQGSADAISFGDGPRIALFLSDDYDTNYGFTVKWEEAPFSGGRNDQQSSPSLRTSHVLASKPKA